LKVDSSFKKGEKDEIIQNILNMAEKTKIAIIFDLIDEELV
jgi:hypothetical protein